jgi:hypothetical protein
MVRNASKVRQVKKMVELLKQLGEIKIVLIGDPWARV